MKGRRKHGLLMPYFPPITTVELQHPSVQPWRRSRLTNTGRGTSTRPLTQDNQLTQTCEQIDFVQRICFMCVWWMKTDEGCMCVYVPTIHPWKQTMNERTALFIRSSRRATRSHGPKATKRPFRLSIQPLPPCLTGIISNKYKSRVTSTADLTN